MPSFRLQPSFGTLVGFVVAVLISGPQSQADGAPASDRRAVEIEWEPIDGATHYEVQIAHKGDKHKKPLTFKVQEAKWLANVKPGTYTMMIRSLDRRGVPGDWSPASDLKVRIPAVTVQSPPNGQVIHSSEQSEEKVKLTWLSTADAVKYKVSIQSTTSNWKMETETTSDHWSTRLPVAEKFKWSVTAIDNEGEAGESNGAGYTFQVVGAPLPKPELKRPRTRFVKTLEWAPVDHASTYGYEIQHYNPDKRKWEKVEAKENQTAPNLKWDYSRPSGRYRVTVQAHGDQREPSKPVKVEFEARGGFRSAEEFERELLRDSINKPSHYYAIASYLITDIQYRGVNYDSDSTPSFSALGGTGRVGLGYQNTESPWGGFGIVDMSGFTIQGQNFTFASTELHATHKLELGQAGLLLLAGGVYYKQLPVLYGSASTSLTGVGKVSNIGPHVGFTYWVPLNDRFGIQTNARVYESLLGQAPNGESVTSSTSFQMGALGSYKLTPGIMGYLGYAYRQDQARFGAIPRPSTSFAQPGDVNLISIRGNYLNLILDVSF